MLFQKVIFGNIVNKAIYGNIVNMMLKIIEHLVYNTGTTKLVSIHALYGDIDRDTLDSRRRKHKFTLFYKMYTDQTPPYLSTQVPPSVNTFSEYSLRNSNDT